LRLSNKPSIGQDVKRQGHTTKGEAKTAMKAGGAIVGVGVLPVGPLGKRGQKGWAHATDN